MPPPPTPTPHLCTTSPTAKARWGSFTTGPCENDMCGATSGRWRNMAGKVVCARCADYHCTHERFPDAPGEAAGGGGRPWCLCGVAAIVQCPVAFVFWATCCVHRAPPRCLQCVWQGLGPAKTRRAAPPSRRLGTGARWRTRSSATAAHRTTMITSVSPIAWQTRVRLRVAAGVLGACAE